MKTLVNSLNCRPAAWALALCALLISAFALRAEETVNYTLETVWEKQEYPPIIVTAAKFHPSGDFIYCAIGNEIRKMDAKTGEYVSVFDKKGIPSEANIYKMEMSKDGKFLATTSLSPELFVWDVTEEKFIKEVKVANQTERQSIYAVDFKEQSNIVVFALDSTIDYPNITEKTTVVVYDWQQEKELFRFDCPGSISELKASPDGKYIATGASWCDKLVKKWHDQIKIWDSQTGKEQRIIENMQSIEKWNGYRQLLFSPNSQYVGWIRKVYDGPQVYDIQQSKLVKQTDLIASLSMNFLPVSNIYVTCLEKNGKPTLDFYDLVNNQSIMQYNYWAGILESVITSENKVLLYDFGDVLTRLFTIKKTIGINNLSSNDIPHILIIDDNIYIENGRYESNKVAISIFDVSARLIFKEEVRIDKESRSALNIHLKHGVYLCKIIADGKEYTQKIEVTR